MTEPDEALLWAREQSALPAVQTVTAHAYRAGAAASAERIKALEEGLSMLCNLFTYVKPSAFRNGVTDPTNTIDEGEVQAGLILDRAKALLKEPDQ